MDNAFTNTSNRSLSIISTLLKTWRPNERSPIRLLTPAAAKSVESSIYYAWNNKESKWYIWPEGRRDESNLYEKGFKKPDLIYYDEKSGTLIVVKVGVCWYWDTKDEYTYLLNATNRLRRGEWIWGRQRRNFKWKKIGSKKYYTILNRKSKNANQYAFDVEKAFGEMFNI